MKKIVALVLVVMLTLSFTACSKKEVTQNGEVPTITWLVMGEKQDDVATVVEAASKISMEKIGAKLDIQFIDDAAYTQRMNMNFASRSADFDICFTGYVNPYMDAALREAYIPLDDYIANSKITESIPEYALENARINGKIYGVPNIQILPTCTGLFINKALADEAKLDVNSIKCLEDIEPFLKWVQENHPEKYPFRTGRYGGGSKNSDKLIGEEVTGSVGVYLDDDGSLIVLTKEERANHAEDELMHDWFNKGYIRADVASAGDDTSEYNAGKFAVWRGWYKPGSDVEVKNNTPVNECYVVKISDAYMTSTAGTGCMSAINVNSKNPELAFKMLELMNTDKEFYNTVCYGVEGKHYNLTDDGFVELIADSGYAVASWKFGNVFNSIPVFGQPADVWEQTKIMNDTAIKSPISGFSFDPTPVRTEIAQMSTVQGKYKNQLVKPASEWRNNYYDDMRKAGIEAVKAEVEKQLKQWQKANK